MLGLSSLRHKNEDDKHEQKKQGNSDQARKLQEYLARQYGEGSSKHKKKKKKKKKKTQLVGGALEIVDHDDTGFKPVAEDTVHEDDAGAFMVISFFIDMLVFCGDSSVHCHPVGTVTAEEEPVIANIEEVERLKRQELKEREMTERASREGGGWKIVHQPEIKEEGITLNGEQMIEEEDDDDIDASPPRRRPRHDSDAEDEDGRHPGGASDSDASPPRRRPRHDSDAEDNDHRYPRAGNDSDASPPRRTSGERDIAGREGGSHRMSDGSLAGMVSGKEIMKEMDMKRKREKERFSKLDDSITGRRAETVYRTAEGRAVSRDQYVHEMEEKRNANRAKYQDAAELPWGKGLKQTLGHSGKDTVSNNSRWGDPMAHLVKNKKTVEEDVRAPPSLLDTHSELLKQSGFKIPLEIPKHSWIRRNIGAPTNRFGIKPGRHWDGVDRSNGFERDLFKRKNELRMREQQARMWAQEDM